MKKTLMTILVVVAVSFLGIGTLRAQSMGGGGHGGGMGGGDYSGHDGGMGGGDYPGHGGDMGGGDHSGYGMMEYEEGMVPYSPPDDHQDRSSSDQPIGPMRD